MFWLSVVAAAVAAILKNFYRNNKKELQQGEKWRQMTRLNKEEVNDFGKDKSFFFFFFFTLILESQIFPFVDSLP